MTESTAEAPWVYAITAHAAMTCAGNVMRYVPPHLIFVPNMVREGLIIADKKPEGWKGAFIGLTRNLSPHSAAADPPTMLAMSLPSSSHTDAQQQLLVMEGRQVMILTPRTDLRMHDILFPGQVTHTVTMCGAMTLHALAPGSVLWINHPRLRMALLFMPTAEYYPLIARNLFETLQYLEGLWCALSMKTPALLEKAWAAKDVPIVPRPAIAAHDPYLQLAVPTTSRLLSPFQMPNLPSSSAAASSDKKEEGADRKRAHTSSS